jgi:hypothetical protein
MTMDSAYKNHHVFEQLSKYAEFYKSLSFSIVGFISQGTKSVINIDAYIYSSIQGTLESIKDILIQGRVNDAYALLRKYYDVAMINIYSDLYLADHFSLENFVVDKINNWLQGRDKLPEYRVMSQYIRGSRKLAKVTGLIYKDKTYKELRDRCNAHTHYNLYYYLLLNINEIYLKDRIAILDRLSKDLEDIFVWHLAYLFYLNDHYMMSSDYLDSLDAGLIPEEGSQYHVAPFVQEIFDSVIKKSRMDLAQEIKAQTAMLLE